MNKMKKILVVLTLAFATLFLAQCKKQIVEQPSVTPTGEKVEVSLNVTDDGSKTGISETGIVTWNTNDVLYVVGESDGYLGSISAQNSGSTAYFTGTITKPSTATQNFHFYYTGSQGFTLDGDCFTYDISHQAGTLATIASNLHLMHGIILNVDKNTTNLGTIKMKSMISIVKLQFGIDPALSATETLGDKVLCTGGFSAIKFNVKTGVDANGNFVSEGRTRYKKNIYLDGVNSAKDGIYYMVVIPGLETLEFSQGLIGKSIAYPQNSSLQTPVPGFLANTIYNTKTVELGTLPYLPAIFTVEKGNDNIQGTEDDINVKFSKGNLQYLGDLNGGDNGTWRFAKNQYDYIGYAKNSLTVASRGNVSDVGSYYYLNYGSGRDETATPPHADIANDKQSARDLFGWGCTGFIDGRDNNSGNQKHYMPYSTYHRIHSDGSTILQSYYGPNYAANPRNNLSVEYQSDWGCIESLPGNSATKKIWRTLSADEWDWLLKNRETSFSVNTVNNARYAFVTINYASDKYCNGLMIFPDEFEWPSGVTPNLINSYVNIISFTGSVDFWGIIKNNHSFTLENFEKLEKAGVVFLPAAGGRLGSNTIGYLQELGSYQTSTNAGETEQLKSKYYKWGYVTVLSFDIQKMYSQYAFSVRLVTSALSDGYGNANPFVGDEW